MQITAQTIDEFKEQFTTILNSEEAKSIKNVIYFFRSEKPIPRVNGENNILYIGKTKNTLQSRYLPSKSFDIECLVFEKFYSYVIKQYGGISIEIRQTNDNKKEECDELQKYRTQHLEYPPLNRSIPNVSA